MCRWARVRLPAGRDAPGLARGFVRGVLSDWDLLALADDLALLTSELVTNAVLHARSESTLTVSVADGSVEVSVADEADAPPRLRPASSDLLADLDALAARPPPREDERGHPGAEPRSPGVLSGRGMRIVDEVADEWGSAPRAGGKAVWLTVPTPEAWPHRHHCVCTTATSGHTASGHPVTDMLRAR